MSKCNSCEKESTRKTHYFCTDKSPDTESSRLVAVRTGPLSKFCPYEYECDVCDEHFLEAEFAIITLECAHCDEEMLYDLEKQFPDFCPHCGNARHVKVNMKCEKCSKEFESIRVDGFFATQCTTCDPERIHGKLVD